MRNNFFKTPVRLVWALIFLAAGRASAEKLCEQALTTSRTGPVKIQSAAELWQELKNHAELYGALASDTQSGPLAGRTLEGRLRTKVIRPGYEAVEIEDKNEVRHLVDPDYLWQTSPPGLSLYTSVTVDDKPVSLVSRRRAPSEPIRIVKPKGAELLVDSILNDGRIYSNPKFYEYLEQNPEIVSNLLSRAYGLEAQTLAKTFSRFPKSLLSLALDPGIACRLKAFAEFAEAFLQKNPFINPWDLRQAFSAQLGSEVLYRGIVLSESSMADLRQHGMWSQLFFQDRDRDKLVRLIDPFRFKPGASSSVGITDEINNRLNGDTRNSLLLSFTQYPEVTSAAVYSKDGLRLKNPGTFYLFKVRVPAINAIKMTGVFKYIPERLPDQAFVQTRPDGTQFSIPFRDPGVEVFLEHADAESIVEIIPYSELPPRWGIQ